MVNYTQERFVCKITFPFDAVYVTNNFNGIPHDLHDKTNHQTFVKQYEDNAISFDSAKSNSHENFSLCHTKADSAVPPLLRILGCLAYRGFT